MGPPIGALALTAGSCPELEALWAPWESWDHADEIHPLDGCVFKGVAPHRRPISQAWLTAPPTNIPPHPTNIPPPPPLTHTFWHTPWHTPTHQFTNPSNDPPPHLHHTHTLTEHPDTPTDRQSTLTYIHWHTHTQWHTLWDALTHLHTDKTPWHTYTDTPTHWHILWDTLTHPHTDKTPWHTYTDTPTHYIQSDIQWHIHTDKTPWHTHTLTKYPDTPTHWQNTLTYTPTHWHTITLTKHPDIHRHTHTLTYIHWHNYTLTYSLTPIKWPIHPLILSLSYCIKQFFHHWVVQHLTDHVFKKHTCTCTYPSSRNTPHVHAPTHPQGTHHMYMHLPILKKHTCTCTYPNRRRCSTADSNSLALLTAPRMIWNEQNSFHHAYQDAKCR